MEGHWKWQRNHYYHWLLESKVGVEYIWKDNRYVVLKTVWERESRSALYINAFGKKCYKKHHREKCLFANYRITWKNKNSKNYVKD